MVGILIFYIINIEYLIILIRIMYIINLVFYDYILKIRFVHRPLTFYFQ